jgi:hypothetical protein
MGDNHPHPGRYGGCTGNLGGCWIADLASARIMSPLNYPFHRSGCVRMKRSPLPKLSRNPLKRKGRLRQENSLHLSSPFSFKKISDFG